MRTTDIIRRAGRNLRQAKVRTLLTALAISVGAFTITLALAAGTGANQYAQTLIESNGDTGRILVIPKPNVAERSSNQQAVPQPYSPDRAMVSQPVLYDKDIQRIAELPHVKSVIPQYQVQATYMQRQPQSKKFQTQLQVKTDNVKVDVVAGTVNQINQVSEGNIMLPQSYLSSLGFSSAQSAIGQTIVLHFDQPSNPLGAGKDVTYTIGAVYTVSSNSLTVQNGITLSAADGKSIYQYQNAGSAASEYNELNVEVDDAKNATQVRDAIDNLGYKAYSFQDMSQTLLQFISVIQWGVASFGALAILASIFGIINTQYISVLERTQQIGLMKALGARRKDIGRLFRYEAAWVGFLGGVIGTALALLVGLANPWIADKLSLEKGTNLLIFKPLYSVILILALMLVAVLAGYFPSRKAAKLDPIEALRTE